MVIECKRKTMKVVGLDVSLKSTGIAIFDTVTNFYTLGCFAQTKKQMAKGCNVPGKEWRRLTNHNCEVLIFPSISGKETDTSKYTHTVKTLEEFFDYCNVDAGNSVIYIEGYAYAKQGAHSYKQKELVGILKYVFHEFTIRTRNISKWKKGLTGNGKASKMDVLEHIHKVSNIDIFTMFGVQYKGIPPSPYQDLADAVGITFGVLESLYK